MFAQLKTRIQNKLSPSPQRFFHMLQIETSLECSLGCVMCPWSELRPANANMSWETFERILPYLSQAREVDLTGGGEPLKNPHLVEMVRAASQSGCQVGFSTSGMHLSSALSERLLEAGLSWISFSVDAATPALYERIRRGARFTAVTNNILAFQAASQRLISDNGGSHSRPRSILVFVMMTGEQQNYQELPEYIELAQRLGVRQVIFKNLDVIVKDGDDERRLFTHDGSQPSAVQVEVKSAIERARQRAGALGIGLRVYALQPQEQAICEHNPLQNLFINWQGIVSPCITLSYAEDRVFAGQRLHVPCQRFGDINTQPLTEIWAHPDYQAFRACYTRRLAAERHATLDHLLGGPEAASGELPPAPEGCRSCYYLYGV